MYVTDAQAFYSYLYSNLDYIGQEQLTSSQRAVVIKFCQAKAPKTVFGKMRLVKRFIKSLISVSVIPPIKVKFKPLSLGVASMFDSGRIVFYKTFLRGQTFAENVMSTLHEVAHVYLWKSEQYKALSDCDQRFIETFVKDVSATVVSPIEYYANLLSLSWLEGAIGELDSEERKKALSMQVQTLKNKINLAKEKVKA